MTKKRKKKLYRVEVRWAREEQRWEVRVPGEERPWPFTRKQGAVRHGRLIAKIYQPSSLVIYKMTGKVQEERTYPRSSDPRRSRG